MKSVLSTVKSFVHTASSTLLGGGLARLMVTALGHISELHLGRSRLALRRATVCGCTFFVCNTSHSGQLSLLPTAGWKTRVPDKGQWQCCAAGKVTVGLASHRPCVTNSVVCLYLRVQWPRKAEEHHTPICSCRSMAAFACFAPFVGIALVQESSEDAPVPALIRCCDSCVMCRCPARCGRVCCRL